MKKISLFLLFNFLCFSFVNQAFSKNNNNKNFEEKSYILKIKTFDGKIFDLEEKKGKVVIVNFWAKWCLDCQKELEVLEEVYKKYHKNNLEIIALNIGKKREEERVKEFSSRFSYQKAMFVNALETSFEEPDEIPLIYIFDKNGKIAKIISGMGSEENSSKLSYKEIEKIIINLF
jgi:thiol-disulfide isomerase/thioredoxin